MISVSATFLTKAGKYFLFGNIFISVCAFCLFWTTCLLIRLPLPLALGSWVALATFFLYNFDSLLPTKLHYHAQVSPHKAWVLAHQQVIVLATGLSGLLVVIWFFYAFPVSYFWLLAHLAVLSVFYSCPVIPTNQGLIPLRNIPILKLILIAYVWSSVTVWLPLLNADVPVLSSKGLLLFLERFLFILPLTIIFDIRDVARDTITTTLTLPRLIGIRSAKLIAYALLLGYLLLVLVTHQGANQLALVATGILYGFIVYITNENRHEYFYALMADGILVVPLIFLLLLQI